MQKSVGIGIGAGVALALALVCATTRAAEPARPHAARAAETAHPHAGGAKVSTIFEQNCTGCHGAQKQKGGLRLDSHAAILKGGEDGAVVVAGKPDESALYKALVKPIGQDGHMPPPKKSQLSKAEIESIRQWIEKGAPEVK